MFRFVLLFSAAAIAAAAHDVITTKLTWSVEVSRIVYRRCVSCHRDGGAAPMPLVTYEQARPWAKAIRDEVLNRRMPPWGAVRGYGEFQDPRGLTQDEITRIAEWVEGGAPEGDPKYLPTSVPAPSAPVKAASGRPVRNLRLKTAVVVAAIKPLGDVTDAKIYAERPDGSIEPLIWLHEYRQKWAHTFVLASPVRLPAGTRIVSSAPAQFELLARP